MVTARLSCAWNCPASQNDGWASSCFPGRVASPATKTHPPRPLPRWMSCVYDTQRVVSVLGRLSPWLSPALMNGPLGDLGDALPPLCLPLPAPLYPVTSQHSGEGLAGGGSAQKGL